MEAEESHPIFLYTLSGHQVLNHFKQISYLNGKTSLSLGKNEKFIMGINIQKKPL
jgi:hypothetical protein